VSAHEDINQTSDLDVVSAIEENTLAGSSTDLEIRIDNAENDDEILINPGTYKLNNVKITKNITLQGNGNARDIIIDGGNESSIFLIRSPDVHVTFKNITFINGLTHKFGGAISIETGNVYVDNCIFINNTALSDTNGGAISNYGTKENRGYLFVNNSLFVNNHADHDGGAIATHYAHSDIYNCVFINNSACRDGGAVRVSVFAYGNVQDCIFMFNHADEWGGAYYSWSGESNIERCIFMNNSAGTNGGAVMVSGNINLQDSIIVNNYGGETGGSFYIQNPMYDTKTVMNIHNNLITNNSSPHGKEVYINWEPDYAYNLYTNFDNNDWGDEDPNDSSVIDPDHVTQRSKVSKTIKSDLFERLNVDLLGQYEDLLEEYFPDDSLNNLSEKFKNSDNNNQDNNKSSTDSKTADNGNEPKFNHEKETFSNNTSTSNNEFKVSVDTSSNQLILGNSTSYGEDDKAYELNETRGPVVKQANLNIKYFVAVIVIVLILLAIGYRRNKNWSK
jgi:predicted outer membrane repeat protein